VLWGVAKGGGGGRRLFLASSGQACGALESIVTNIACLRWECHTPAVVGAVFCELGQGPVCTVLGTGVKERRRYQQASSAFPCLAVYGGGGGVVFQHGCVWYHGVSERKWGTSLRRRVGWGYRKKLIK